MKIDKTSLAIIKHLREGRKSFQKIAKSLSITENTVRSRVKRLVEEGVLDVTGLAQKNGAVMSFLRFGNPGEPLYSPRIGLAAADAVLGCDVLVTAGREALARMAPGRTRVVANLAATPTADFTRNPDWKFPLGQMEASIIAAIGDPSAAAFVDATRHA